MPSISPITKTEDASNGLITNVLNALKDGTLILKMSANKLAVYAVLGNKLECAVHATQVMSYLMEFVLKIQIDSFHLEIVSVKYGRRESVSNVQIDLISIKMEFADKLVLNAIHGINLTESA